jgi:hypothetical protein
MESIGKPGEDPLQQARTSVRARSASEVGVQPAADLPGLLPQVRSSAAVHGGAEGLQRSCSGLANVEENLQ